MGPRRVFYNSQMKCRCHFLIRFRKQNQPDEQPLKRCIIITLDSCLHLQPICDLHRKCGRSDSSAARQQEKFLYICDTLHMWEWDIQVLDIYEGTKEDEVPACLGGRGATPPELCGGPTGYRLMLKRQNEGGAMLAPAMVETGILMLAEACPDQSAETWELLRAAMDEGLSSIDQRWPPGA